MLYVGAGYTPQMRDGKQMIFSAVHRREVTASLRVSRKEEEIPSLLGDGMERTLGSYLDLFECKIASGVRASRVCVWAFMM